MTQEEKKILFKDLCARLAYGVKVKVERTTANGEKIEDEGVLNSIFINEFGTIYVCVDEVEYELEDIKPYLRPMSSMAEAERFTGIWRTNIHRALKGLTNKAGGYIWKRI